jgi:hypothetical protein
MHAWHTLATLAVSGCSVVTHWQVFEEEVSVGARAAWQHHLSAALQVDQGSDSPPPSHHSPKQSVAQHHGAVTLHRGAGRNSRFVTWRQLHLCMQLELLSGATPTP